MLIGLPDFSCFKIFTFHCFKSVTPFVVQEWYPSTTAIHLQTPTIDSSSAQPTVVSCTSADQGRAVFSQPEIGSRFESNAANIAKALLKALFKLNYKIQYPWKSGSEKQSRSYFLRFFFKNSSSKQQKRFAIGGYIPPCFLKPIVSFL